MTLSDGPEQIEGADAAQQRAANETHPSEKLSPPEAKHADCKCKRKKKSGWKIAQRAIAIFTLIFVGIYTVVTLCLYEVTKKTMVASNRAWIEPRIPRITSGLNPTENFEYELPYANIGKEPALQIVLQHEIHFVEPKSPGKSWYERFQGRNEYCSISHPNRDGLVEYPSGQEHKVSPVLEKPLPGIGAVLNATQVLVIEGCYGYLTFDEPHYSAFCYFLPPIEGKPAAEWLVKRCPTHNDAT